MDLIQSAIITIAPIEIDAQKPMLSPSVKCPRMIGGLKNIRYEISHTMIVDHATDTSMPIPLGDILVPCTTQKYTIIHKTIGNINAKNAAIKNSIILDSFIFSSSKTLKHEV
jgi:hypothetical protein